MAAADATDLCIADTSGLTGVPDCKVNVDDLLAVINAWGTCSPGPCAANIVPATPCPPTGSGAVDVDDLLMVINSWGPCPYSGCTMDESSMPQSISDCMDAASERYEAYSTEWDEFVNDCVDALCAAELIDCD